MIVRSIANIAGTARVVTCPRGMFVSQRLLLADDRLGFSMHRTVIARGGPYVWHYRHHMEACYCVTGRATLTDTATGDTWAIAPGTLYAPDQHDSHQFHAYEPTELICVFRPALIGTETHAADGSYPLLGHVA